MAEIRVLVGTRKGAFVITSDGVRQHWKIDGPHFGGPIIRLTPISTIAYRVKTTSPEGKSPTTFT